MSILRKRYLKREDLCEAEVLEFIRILKNEDEKKKAFDVERFTIKSTNILRGTLHVIEMPIPIEDLTHPAEYFVAVNSLLDCSIIYSILRAATGLYCDWREVMNKKEKIIMQPYASIYSVSSATNWPSIIIETYFCEDCGGAAVGSGPPTSEARESNNKKFICWMNAGTLVQAVFLICVGADDHLIHQVYYKEKNFKDYVLLDVHLEPKRIEIPYDLIYYGGSGGASHGGGFGDKKLVIELASLKNKMARLGCARIIFFYFSNQI